MPGHGFIPGINEAVQPGEEAEVEVVFDPAAHGTAGVGKIERLVYVENNGSRTMQFLIKASVTP